jgi:predicted phosphate transport protein (TIGR00153 family)
MLEKLMPRSDEFFDAFDAQAKTTAEGTKLLHELLEDLSGTEEKVRRIKEVEHEGDHITHLAFERLHTQFITPFDRAEIHRLLSRIDDVLDLADGAAERIHLYEITDVPPEARELARVLHAATLKMQEAMAALREIKKPKAILEACKEINRLENEADGFLRRGLAQLFKSGADPLTVIKWKEIYELIEEATDRCEDVANVIEGVVLEHS